MAKWWKFGRGRGKEEAPRPEPTPAPTPAPTPPTPAAPEKRGLFGRLKDRLRGRKEEAPPEAPPAPPTPPAEAPPAPGEEAAPEAGEGAPPAAPPPPERVYPKSLHVDAEGNWIISETEWEGNMSGTLHGADVKTFIDAMEAEGGPDYETAIPLIADSYGIPGGLIDVGRSTIYRVDY